VLQCDLGQKLEAITSGERGRMDENTADTISPHRREGPIEIREGAHTDGQKLNPEFPSGSLGNFQKGPV
jgi:hypothetical protein